MWLREKEREKERKGRRGRYKGEASVRERRMREDGGVERYARVRGYNARASIALE